MREILFRGKRTDNGEWVQGDLLLDQDLEQAQIVWFDYKSTEDGVERDGDGAIVIPETVGQYTGLTDKNGRRIFEGDIVRTKKYGKVVGHVNVNDYDTFQVVYEPAIFRLVNPTRGFNLVGQAIDWEVISNIYDNPELLEVKQNEM